MQVSIRVVQNADRKTVAYKLMPLPDPLYQAERVFRIDCKLEARRLSKVYGRGFWVEVWVDYDTYDGYRAYVYSNGSIGTWLGF